MDDTERLWALIGDIYDAAFDPAQWGDVLRKARNFETRQRLIAPHIQRATLVGKMIAEAATFADTLDGIGAGIFLVDATGDIVHANAAGHVMLKEASVLHAHFSACGKIQTSSWCKYRTLSLPIVFA
jgi:PAS domain-containing protein